MSEHATQLGVVHLNELIFLPGVNRGSPAHLTDGALCRLHQNADKLHFLQILDVLGHDEFGNQASEMIRIAGIVLCHTCNSIRTMGVMLLIATMDTMQLHPVHGTHPLSPLHMISSFSFLQLEHSAQEADTLHGNAFKRFAACCHTKSRQMQNVNSQHC